MAFDSASRARRWRISSTCGTVSAPSCHATHQSSSLPSICAGSGSPIASSWRRSRATGRPPAATCRARSTPSTTPSGRAPGSSSPRRRRSRPAARAMPGRPGIYSAEQVAGWRLVTEAVHARGRQDRAAALARRAHLAPFAAARRRAAGRALGGRAGQAEDVHRGRHLRRDRHAARARLGRAARRSSTITAARRATRWPPVSTGSRSTPRTATCCTSSSATRPTSAPTRTAARPRTGCAFRSK